MKLQLAPGMLRLRLAPGEFDDLRNGARLTLSTTLPGGRWNVELVSAPQFSISLAGGRLEIGVPQAELDALQARLPSREGLRWEIAADGHSCAVVLEVDVRDRGAPRMPAR